MPTGPETKNNTHTGIMYRSLTKRTKASNDSKKSLKGAKKLKTKNGSLSSLVCLKMMIYYLDIHLILCA